MYPTMSSSVCPGECEDLIGSGWVVCSVRPRLREGEARIPREKSVAVALSKGNRWVGGGGNNIYPL